MSRLFWLLIAALSVSFLVLQLMLGMPEMPHEDRQRTATDVKRRTKPETASSEGTGRSAVLATSQTAGHPRPGLPDSLEGVRAPKAAEDELSEDLPEWEELEQEDELFDEQAFEEQMLQEQIAESLTNPAYLTSPSWGISATPDSEGVEEAEDVVDDIPPEVASEPDLAVDELEDDSQAATQLFTSDISDKEESAPQLDPAEERALMSESGFYTGSDAPDFNQVEEQQ
jgi:type IV secretory pathway VirB10-like protein